MGRIRVGRLAMACALVVVLAAGVLFSRSEVRRAELRMKGDLQLKARLVAQTLNTGTIKSLYASDSDLTKPHYGRLKAQFITLRHAGGGCLSIYLLGRTAEGTIHFLLDSEPPDSRDYSPPGKTYEDASGGVQRLFNTSGEGTEGPGTDRSATRVSAFVPIRDTKGGEAIAMLGMDFDAGDWNWRLARAATPPALGTLALVAILLAYSALKLRRPRLSTAPPWMQYLEPSLAGLIGLVLTLVTSFLIHGQKVSTREKAFSQLAQRQTQTYADVLRNLSGLELERMGRFYLRNEDIDSDEFRHFTSYLTNTPAIKVWEWIPEVPAAERERFETEARWNGLNGFQIWRRDSQGFQTPASGSESYYPVFRATPLEGNEDIIGHDLGSEHRTLAAIEEAKATRLPVISGPITIARDTAVQDGIEVLRPVYSYEEPNSLAGFILSVVQNDRFGLIGRDR